MTIAINTAALLAGTLLCAVVIAIAIRRFRQDKDVKDLLTSLAAAAVALVSGAVTQFIVIVNLSQPETGFSGVTDRTVMVSYLSSLLSIPAGMGWGWACSFGLNPANATRRPSAPGFVVGGLVCAVVATNVFVVATLVAGLAWHGHNSTIGLPGLSLAFSFLGLMTLLATGIASNFRTTRAGLALRRLGAGSISAIILGLGIYVGAVAVDSLLMGARRLAEAWNVLIFFYPIYLMVSFGIAGGLLFYGGRMFARTWFRLSGAGRH